MSALVHVVSFVIRCTRREHVWRQLLKTRCRWCTISFRKSQHHYLSRVVSALVRSKPRLVQLLGASLCLPERRSYSAYMNVLGIDLMVMKTLCLKRRHRCACNCRFSLWWTMTLQQWSGARGR